MTPVQQQILAQWQQQVGQITGRFQQTLAEATAGCKQLVARNPIDIGPLRNVFGAIDAQRKEAEHALSDAWSATRNTGVASSRGPSSPRYARSSSRDGKPAFVASSTPMLLTVTDRMSSTSRTPMGWQR
jgi:hypothetical protein